MGSASNSNPNPYPWTPKDCSEGICSIYCPQWCYIVYSPPPPSLFFGADSDADDPSGFEFSPLIVAVIGILASTFILVTYYTIISRFCRRSSTMQSNDSAPEEDGSSELGQVSSSSNSGLDEALIKSIKVCKYTKGVVEAHDCSVCLSEFEENESLRLLPKCNHAFHLPCIDPWLKSHATCPLCRSTITIVCPNPAMEPPPTLTVNALEYQHRSSHVLVVVVQSSEQQHKVLSFDSHTFNETEG
ncbi:RING-H2 finger protein ATL52-like [Vigna radiata var. radiata]|uniref:RING-type E3 ubiquitin transferase n=1 Tax=Vigna radiata var. radiata TaxID=3916 RepID=A0A1S3U2E9_VIGRR|nr:RING-H2 finger protein ATL52-like [Vigna radiata var. radiata]XP_022637206.1 RING-H2 finger protein ATL52-like [Vigna radiata var. radiata]